MNRRAMLWRCLSAAGLSCRFRWAAGMFALCGKPAVPARPRYRRLKQPVVLPLQSVDELWRPVCFTAHCRKIRPAGGPSADLLLKGILLRLPAPQAARLEWRLKAFCLICTHELCELNFVEDPRSVREVPASRWNAPVLVCPCHFSVFDPLADGGLISGPAERGAYRFLLTVHGKRVEIREVEEAALR